MVLVVLDGWLFGFAVLVNVLVFVWLFWLFCLVGRLFWLLRFCWLVVLFVLVVMVNWLLVLVVLPGWLVLLAG